MKIISEEIETTKTKTKYYSIKKRRNIMYFIEAASEMIDQSGVESLTIRGVSEAAGFNPSSFYLHFNNLDQLIAYTSINAIKDYYYKLDQLAKDQMHCIKRLINVWKAFAECCANYPESTLFLYFSPNEEERTEYFSEYFEVFPGEDGAMESSVKDAMGSLTVVEKDDMVIRSCIKEGYFSEEDAKEISEVGRLLCVGMITLLRRNVNHKSAEANVSEFMHHFAEFIKPKLLMSYPLDELIKNLMKSS